MVTANAKAVVAWSLYDWANSAFTTLVVTFVYATYFSQAIAPDEVTGTVAWSRAVAISGIVIALLAPVFGTMADQRGARRRYLMVATLVCILATSALTFVAPGQAGAVASALLLFAVANIAFELGMVFYNALLPVVSPPERLGRISGYGWGLGYVGGLGCLVLALVILVREVPLFGISTEAGFNFRATNLLVAAWFLVFSVPVFLYVREPDSPGVRAGIADALRETARTVREVRRYREIAKFLVARIVYNDGLITVFAFGGIYAAGTFGMTLAEVIQFGIAINVAAGLGAWLFGHVDDRLGGRATILITLVALIVFTLMAAMAPDRAWLWVAAIGIGIFVGPNQSASRSLMGRLAPERTRNQFFGFFALSGKITAFAGPLLLGVVTGAFESQRAGVASVVAFFAVGFLLLLTVKEPRRGGHRRQA